MSKLLKSKILLGVMIFAVMFAGVALVSKVASAADCASGIYKIGSRGAAVTCIQEKVGVPTPTGYYGTITAGLVKAFQVANPPLKADGIAGPATIAALNGIPSTGTTYPAGCTSTAGFSTTTGASCAATTTLPAGCTSTVGYSSTTGAKCDSTTTDSTVLTGSGEMDTIKKFTSGTETVLGEGKSEKVLGVELEATNDGDLAVKAIRLELTHNGNGSTRLEHYVGKVAVYMGSTKVGEADASDFSRTSNVSTKTINLENVVVKAGEKVRLTVSMEANDTIQGSLTASQDDINGDWDVLLTKVTTNDANGAILFYVDGSDFNNIGSNVTFEDSTTNDDVKLQSAGSSNPAAGNLQVETSTSSDDYKVFAFKLKVDASSSDVNVLSVPVVFTLTNPAGGDASVLPADMINDVYLKVGNTTYDNYSITDAGAAMGNGGTDTTEYTFDIDEGDLTIDADNTATVDVYVTFEKQSGKYDLGATLKGSAVAGDLVVENTDGDSITVTGGTIAGNLMTLQSTSLQFTLEGATVVTSTPQNSDNYTTFLMPIKVTTDTTLYVLKDASATAVNATVTGGVSKVSSWYSGSTASIVNDGTNDYYEINNGDIIKYRVIVTGDDTGSASDVVLQLNSIDASDSAGGSTTTYSFSPASNFDAIGTLVY